MAKNKEQLRSAEEFIQNMLAKYFNQKVNKKTLRASAEKLVESIPEPIAKPVEPKKAA